ncbi:hypothetical protein [Amycolatopsis sp. CA-230715]|uniref:hypothetical protein n=1 Tax=Amycolatopsis sp. CA-230715 TaxID=2745196 RepID=UPI001C015747|nr:hypothetical protein [Amycolatopsis sp. CA-230715]
MKEFPNVVLCESIGGPPKVHAPNTVSQTEHDGLRTPKCLKGRPAEYLINAFYAGKRPQYKDTEESVITCKACLALLTAETSKAPPVEKHVEEPSFDTPVAKPRLSPKALKAVPEIAEFLRDLATRDNGCHDHWLLAAATVLETQAVYYSARKNR